MKKTRYNAGRLWNPLLFFIAASIAAIFLTACAQQTQYDSMPTTGYDTALPNPESSETPQEAKKYEIAFKASPNSATAGQEFSVSWDVSGESEKIPHTAIHYGPQSVPDPKGPGDYPKATNFQCQDTPCAIPNSFSANMKIDAPGTYYYRAHAVVDGKNVWSEEKMVTVTPPSEQVAAGTGKPYNVAISNYAYSPRTIKIAQGDTITWTNMDSAPHTVSSYGGDELASETLSKGQTYTHTFNTEGTFEYQCNIHPLMRGEVVVLSIEPKITITSAPPLVATGQAIPISWMVDGKGATTPHTAIHYGPQSVPDPKGPSDYPFASNFFCTTKPCSIPNEFLTQIKISEPGNYSYRAHAVIDGKNIWSDEKIVSVEKLAQPVRTAGGGGGGGY